jgi:hypoxanthine phosphoribosyltransferase
MKLNTIQVLIFIILITTYHYYIHNGLEKIFSQIYLDYDSVKRPLFRCKNRDNNSRLGCIGMPSGHAETSSVFSFLLYFNKIIPLWVCLLIISLISIQRITSHMHTLSQVVVGSILGLLYASIYKKYSFGYGFIIVLTIGLLLTSLSIYKIDSQVHGPIPNWVDKSMYENIKKKQDSPFYMKIGSIYTNSFIHNTTFISWNELESYLDKMVERINNSEIKYDAVVGIKTGGAIISDYISFKLGLPNYKIKLSRDEYNCNKTPNDFIDDIVKKNLFYRQEKYQICEGIDDNLEGKNIILVDELVSTGKTMEESYNYLREKKYANIVYPTCIALYKYKYRGSLYINNVLNGTVLIWPWGYDN